MEKMIEELAEYVCDKKCKYACMLVKKQEELDEICNKCKLATHMSNIVLKHNEILNKNIAMESQAKSVADYYGYANQSGQLIEKMAELMVAIKKYDRVYGSDDLINAPAKKFLDVKHLEDCIFEKIADVEIMLAQIKHLLGCSSEVESIKEMEITRQLMRIAEEREGLNK
ncbi:MAG: hypothetical protein E7267_03820 [Lachnospiraceae bacterium]|nr:hypothetical protein [Lachnospiraceae bacterium]